MTTSATTGEKFNAAVNVIRNLPRNGPFQPSDQMKLLFYSYYKQATEGPCKESKPAFWEVVKKAKWDAWMRLGDMTKEDAMNSYIEELKKVTSQIVETMSYTEDVALFVDKIGPFYDMVDLPLPVKKPEKQEGDEKTRVNNVALNERKENGLTNGVPHSPADERADCNDAESGVPMRDAQSERFYSGSESDDDEYADPVPNDDSEDKALRPNQLISNGDDGGGIDAESGGDDCLFIGSKTDRVLASFHPSKEQKDHKPDSNHELKINGVPVGNGGNGLRPKDLLNDSDGVRRRSVRAVDGVAHRGGGDPTANSSTGRIYRPGSRRPVFHTGKAYAGGSQELSSSSSRQFVAGSGGGHRQGPNGGHDNNDVNEQIAETLFQLQRDMESVLTRLSTLEALTVANHNITHSRMVSVMTPEVDPNPLTNWWPFRNVPAKAVLIFMAWPVVLQIIIYLIRAHRVRLAARRWHR